MIRFISALGALSAALLAATAVAADAPRSSAVGWFPRDTRYPGVVRVHVDARDVDRGIFHVTEQIPVHTSGPMTLLFPKWVPGNHAPTARIERLAGITISANGKALPWTRDSVDMHAFHLRVPEGVPHISVHFQYLSATSNESGRVVATSEMLNLQWFSLLLYPSGHQARQIMIEPAVTLPDQWRFATQLNATAQTGSTVRFATLDLERLIDSPLFAGRHYRQIPLGVIGRAPVYLDVFADEPSYLSVTTAAVSAHRRLIAETNALFRDAPFPRYNFLLGLTQELGGIATEHLASSEITREPHYLSDGNWGSITAHELVHSWNGKAKRPHDLWSPDFNAPMRNSMLWLYEGQTQFWAFVLAARSGLITQAQAMDVFARLAANHMQQPGRTWRALADTSNDAIITRELVDEPWPSWHRELNDSYTEANLMWLEADGIIRSRSGGKRSLDDFAMTFFHTKSEQLSLYSYDDVVEALNRIEPYDWRGFFNERLHLTAPAAPTEWLRRSGHRLVFDAQPSEAYALHHKLNNRLDLRFSIGLVMRADASGKVTEVIWGSPAFQAGIVPEATILAVNGKAFSPELLTNAIEANRGGRRPIELQVNMRNRKRTTTINYSGGLRFPKLERVPGLPDYMTALLRPRMRRMEG